MKYISIITIAFIFISMPLSSQVFERGDIAAGASAQLNLPLGDFGKSVNTSFGLGGQFHYFMTENISIGANLGYLLWPNDIDGFSLNTIESTGAGRYYFSQSEMSFYGAADIGLFTSLLKNEYDIPGVSNESETETETDFGFALGAGVLYMIENNLSVDINLKYTTITGDLDINYIALKAGIVYFL